MVIGKVHRLTTKDKCVELDDDHILQNIWQGVVNLITQVYTSGCIALDRPKMKYQMDCVMCHWYFIVSRILKLRYLSFLHEIHILLVLFNAHRNRELYRQLLQSVYFVRRNDTYRDTISLYILYINDDIYWPLDVVYIMCMQYDYLIIIL